MYKTCLATPPPLLLPYAPSFCRFVNTAVKPALPTERLQHLQRSTNTHRARFVRVIVPSRTCELGVRSDRIRTEFVSLLLKPCRGTPLLPSPPLHLPIPAGQAKTVPRLSIDRFRKHVKSNRDVACLGMAWARIVMLLLLVALRMSSSFKSSSVNDDASGLDSTSRCVF